MQKRTLYVCAAAVLLSVVGIRSTQDVHAEAITPPSTAELQGEISQISSEMAARTELHKIPLSKRAKALTEMKFAPRRSKYTGVATDVLQRRLAAKQAQLINLYSRAVALNDAVDKKAAIEAEAQRKADEERVAKELAQKKADEQKHIEAQRAKQREASGTPQFGANGLLIESATPKAQNVINLEMGIPGHANGAGYHKTSGLDSAIDGLTAAEAVYVLHRIEGAGFGQTGAGYAGSDTPTTHHAFVDQQVNGRFGGSVKELLKHWGTYSYTGY